jgi:hypothetical protein
MMTSEIEMNYNLIDSIARANVSERLSWPQIQAQIIKILQSVKAEF